MHHVWIASQDSHEIRLYHSTHFVSLLEISIRTSVIQKLQGNIFFFSPNKSISNHFSM
jgi:hypothetical protein